MKKAIKISIPEPCHEDWAKMTATEKGKHCAVCTKEVVDFTEKSDETIFKYVEKNDNTCGRFKPSQLDRTIKLERKERNSFIPWAASFLLPFTMLQLGAANAEVEKSAKKNYTSLGIGRFSNTAERAQIVTKGTVKDHNGVAMHNVKITASETEAVVWTAKDGSFTFTSLDHEVLTFQKDGYATQLNKRGATSEIVEVKLISELKIPLQIMGGMRVLEPVVPLEPVSETTTKGKIAEEIVEVITGDIVEVVEVTVVETIEKGTQVTISGTVTDDNGVPLPGVNVIIEGTTTGTQTDFDGNYSIDANPGQILVFSYISYETKVVSVSTISNTVSFAMELSNEVMGELIIVGYAVGYAVGYEETVRTTEEKKIRNEERRQAEDNLNKFYKKQQKEKKAARKARRDKK